MNSGSRVILPFAFIWSEVVDDFPSWSYKITSLASIENWFDKALGKLLSTLSKRTPFFNVTDEDTSSGVSVSVNSIVPYLKASSKVALVVFTTTWVPF